MIDSFLEHNDGMLALDDDNELISPTKTLLNDKLLGVDEIILTSLSDVFAFNDDIPSDDTWKHDVFAKASWSKAL